MDHTVPLLTCFVSAVLEARPQSGAGCVHYDCARHTSYENAILMNWSSAPGSLLRSGLPRQRIEGDAAPLRFAMLVWRCAAAAHTHWYCLASAW